jgi:chemotaxis protein MotA
MDFATIVGLLVGMFCIMFAIIADGGHFRLFFNVPALLIVVGGTIAAAMIHFSMGQVLNMMAVVKKVMFYKIAKEQDLIQKMVNYCAISRRDGVLALEAQLPSAGDSFLVRAIQMVIDGQKAEAIEEHLSLEIANLSERHYVGKKILDFMGSGCPAFGMVGTLIGLVQMFSAMENPQAIGAGMATALVCTLYGAFVANLFFIPMAGKLGIRSKKETQLREMILEGVLGIVRGDSPTAVRERMQAFVSVRHREDLKPKI